MIVFVVSQVDGEGYVLPTEFANVVSNWYKEDSLKTLVKRLAPECITQANARAKGRYKVQIDLTPNIPSEFKPSNISWFYNLLLYIAYFKRM